MLDLTFSVGRTEPNLDDVALAFQEMDVNFEELADYVKCVDPLPFAKDVPKFPVPKPNHFHFPHPNSRELAEREEHVDDHLPPMHPGWEGKKTKSDCRLSKVFFKEKT